MLNYFLGPKIGDMKHVKTTQKKKQTAKININVGTIDLPGNKNSDEITYEIIEFANSIKTSDNNVIASSIVSRKVQFKNKAKEVNENSKYKCAEQNLQLIRYHKINPFRHTNAKDLHLNNYGDKILSRNFTSFVENG